MGALAEVTDSNFEEQVTVSELPVLVDFWAPWCGPCKAMTPILEELQQEFQGKLKIVKLNVDENPQVTARYSVRSIPTMIFFKDGVREAVSVGAKPISTLREFLNSYC